MPTPGKKKAKPELRVVDEFTAFLRKHSTVEMISKRTGSPYRIARLAGHNVAQFGCRRLASMFKRYDWFLPAESYRPLDTLQLARWASTHVGREPKSFKLTDLREASEQKKRCDPDTRIATLNKRLDPFAVPQLLVERLARAGELHCVLA